MNELRIRWAIAGAVGTLGALVGCAPDGSGGGVETVAEFQAETIEIVCARMFECCTDEEVAMQFEGFTDPPANAEECTALFSAFLMIGGSLEASETMGRLRYEAAAGSSCVDAMRDLACDAFPPGAMPDPETIEPSCDDALVPLVAEGGACTQDVECTTGHCERMGMGDGACRALPGMGEPCTFDCAEGLSCQLGSSGPTCQPRLADGSECSSDSDCASGACIGADPMTGTRGSCGTPAPMCDGR